MNYVKLLNCNNFQTQYLVTEDNGDYYSLLSEEGEFVQIKKAKLEVDSVEEVLGIQFYELSNTPAFKSAVLKHRIENTKGDLEKCLKTKFTSLNMAKHSYLGENDENMIQFFYSSYDSKTESCTIDIFENQIKNGEDHLREVFVLVLEEFGNLYLDGQRLRDYLGEIKPQKKNGKKFWSLEINYHDLIGVKGHSPFQFYSDDMNYVLNFTNKTFENNVVDFNVIRNVYGLERDLTRRGKGFTLKRKAA